MSDSTAVAPPISTRGPTVRVYVDKKANTLTRRIKGQPDEVRDVNNIPEDLWHDYAFEGVAHALVTHTWEEIVAGKALPARAAPGTGEKVARPKAELGVRRKAIAEVKCADMISAKKASGQKPSKEEIAEMKAASEAWARSLTAESVLKLMNHAEVKVVHARLTGKSDLSLDAMLSTPASAMAEAAD